MLEPNLKNIDLKTLKENFQAVHEQYWKIVRAIFQAYTKKQTNKHHFLDCSDELKKSVVHIVYHFYFGGS